MGSDNDIWIHDISTTHFGIIVIARMSDKKLINWIVMSDTKIGFKLFVFLMIIKVSVCVCMCVCVCVCVCVFPFTVEDSPDWTKQ